MDEYDSFFLAHNYDFEGAVWSARLAGFYVYIYFVFNFFFNDQVCCQNIPSRLAYVRQKSQLERNDKVVIL